MLYKLEATFKSKKKKKKRLLAIGFLKARRGYIAWERDRPPIPRCMQVEAVQHGLAVLPLSSVSSCSVRMMPGSPSSSLRQGLAVSLRWAFNSGPSCLSLLSTEYLGLRCPIQTSAGCVCVWCVSVVCGARVRVQVVCLALPQKVSQDPECLPLWVTILLP